MQTQLFQTLFYTLLYTLFLYTNRYIFFLDMFKRFVISRPAFFQCCFKSCHWPYQKKMGPYYKKQIYHKVNFVPSTFFIFNNSIYKQTFGTSWGLLCPSCWSPIIADIVMQTLENYTLNALKLDLPLYIRYMDDIVLTVPTDKIDTILNMFNSYHSRLQFTVEYEFNHCLSFFDLSLKRMDDKLIINEFHKETFLGKYLSYYSCYPLFHKIGTIYGLVDRAVLLSHLIFHKKNLEFVIFTGSLKTIDHC